MMNNEIKKFKIKYIIIIKLSKIKSKLFSKIRVIVVDIFVTSNNFSNIL